MTYSEFLTVDDVATITGYSKGKSGNIIRALNGELKEKGINTITSKVSKKYFRERFNITLD